MFVNEFKNSPCVLLFVISIESNILKVGRLSKAMEKYVFGKVDGNWKEVDQIAAPSGSVYFGDELVLARMTEQTMI
jgi:hypothetical protein